MPDTFRQRADELRARAAQERDPGRQRYLAGLAASWEQLARLHGEPEPNAQPEQPAVITATRDKSEPASYVEARRTLAAALRGRGYSQKHIAERLTCSQRLVSVFLREAAPDGGRPYAKARHADADR